MPLPENPSPVPARPLARDHAYTSIREAILNGSIEPGQRLDDAALEAWLGVSRTPIRQALLALTREGFIETARQSHTRVMRAAPQEAETYLQAAGALVLGMTIITLPVITPEQRQSLCEALRLAGQAIEERNINGLIARSTQHWTTVAEICPNAHLRRLVQQSAPALGYHAVVAATQSALDWQTLAKHNQDLLAALRDGNNQAAEDATRQMFELPPR